MEKIQTYVQVRVSAEQIEKRLLDCLDMHIPNRTLIAKVIIENLTMTDLGLAQLYNAFSGIKPEVHVKIGDDVLVEYKNLSWRMNKPRMEEAGMIYKKKYVKGVVHDIDLRKTDSIGIQYTYMPDSGDAATDTYFVDPSHVIKTTEEYPEDLGDGF